MRDSPISLADNSVEDDARPRTRTDEQVFFNAVQRLEELTNAIAAREGFIAVVGYELRNSLAPLVLLAEQFERLGEGAVHGPMRSRIALLTRYLRSFTMTIDRIAEVAQLREGKLELHRSQVDLSTVVREVCTQFERQALAGGVELLIDAPDPVIGYWDRVRLKQIAANLVSNAIRYGGEGAVVVSLDVREGEVELTVRDHGVGVPVDELQGIFDRFDHRSSRKSGGFGIGLFVVKTLVVAMGGIVRAENAANGGARFSVVLPRA